MGLDRKLDEIRQKPEHIRTRYVWGGVIICMLFVVMIWFFTMKSNFSHTDTESTGSFTDLKEEFDEAAAEQPDMPSIEDFVSNDPLYLESVREDIAREADDDTNESDEQLDQEDPRTDEGALRGATTTRTRERLPIATDQE